MGAGQIGGIATLLDIDFNNAAGFIGTKTEATEAQFIVYYLSHAMMFCVGALLEAHVVLTPASCVFGERYKFDVFGGTHKFLEHVGVPRLVQHLCLHRGYNHSKRWAQCSHENLALLVLNKQFSFHRREIGSEFLINRVRYGTLEYKTEGRVGDTSCRYYGWGSRRNGYLIPLLINIRRVDVNIMHPNSCPPMWDGDDEFICIQSPQCKSSKYGTLCPDDMGSLLVCSGFAQGMMTSRLVDRPCGIGFLDLARFNKFLTCAVDDSRDVIDHDDLSAFEFGTPKAHQTLAVITPPPHNNTSEEETEKKKKTKTTKQYKSDVSKDAAVTKKKKKEKDESYDTFESVDTDFVKSVM